MTVQKSHLWMILFLFLILAIALTGCVHKAQKTQATPTISPSLSSMNYPFSNENMFFGLTILKEDRDYELASELKVSWLSMQPVIIWAFHEPEPGKYRWNPLDDQIKRIQSLGMDCTPVLIPMNAFGEKRKLLMDRLQGRDPTAFIRSQEAAELELYPKGETMDLWKSFLRELVDRYDGDGKNDMPGLKYPIRNWHFLEEYPEIWIGSAENYVYLLKESSTVIREEDPDARIILMGLASNYARYFAFADGFIEDDDAGVFKGKKYTRKQISSNRVFQQKKAEYEFILKEAKDYFDVVDIHLYEEKLSFMKGKISWLKHKMEEYGYNKPIWCIEGGGPFKIPEGSNPRHGDCYFGYYTDKENAEFVVKMHVIAAWSGIERFHWGLAAESEDSYWDGPWRVMALTTSEREKKPSFFTFNIMANLLSDFNKVEDINLSLDNISIYRFETPKGVVYVLWDESEKWHTVDLSEIEELKGKRLNFIPIVTELNSQGEPIIPEFNCGTSDSIPLSETPIFIAMGC